MNAISVLNYVYYMNQHIFIRQHIFIPLVLYTWVTATGDWGKIKWSTPQYVNVEFSTAHPINMFCVRVKLQLNYNM
jgi:hypothetical protein